MFGKSLGSPISTGSEDDVENKAVTERNVQVESDRDVVQIVDAHEEHDLSRSLSQRHIQMIALAGAIVRRPPIFCLSATNDPREQDSSSVSVELYSQADPSALCSDMR